MGSSPSCLLCLGLKASGEIIHLCKLLSHVCSAMLQRMGPCPRSDGRWRSYSPRQESQDRWSPIREKSTLIYLLIRQVKILMLFLIDILSTWRRQWHPTPVLLPGKSHGWRSLVGCSPWGPWGSDTTERLHFHFSLFTFMHWRGKWQPTPVFLPGESRGWGSLVGCCLWGHTESDTTEVT